MDSVAVELASRVQTLRERFAWIGAVRMAGVPMLNPLLEVATVGFGVEPGGRSATGVLITPWFMNLVWLPLQHDEPVLASGMQRERAVGSERFLFVGAQEEGVGAFESCSLFSPMFEFADQAAALATAEQVLAILRQPPKPPQHLEPTPPAAPSRRHLLFGRAPGAAA